MNNGMIVAEVSLYQKLLKKLSQIPFNTLFAQAVLESKAHGTVFVDNMDEPKTVYIAHSYGMSLLFGDTENESFNTSLYRYMLNIDHHRSTHEWLQVYPDKWNTKLGELFNSKILDYAKLEDTYSPSELEAIVGESSKDHVIQWRRVNFAYNFANQIPDCPVEYQIKPITSEIYDQIEGSVIPKYFWSSREQFLSEGVGFALVIDNAVASIAFSSCKFGADLEIGVETMKNYRGMGLAKYACWHMLAYCRANNYTPIWACRKENVGSYKLAKSLGFEESVTLPYYELVSAR